MIRRRPIVFLLLLALPLLVSCGNREDQKAENSDPQKQQIREFWDTFHRATSLRTSGQYDEAVLAYEKALKINPQHEESLYYLGSAQMELGDFPEAVRTFRRLLELNPRSNRGLSQLGLLLSTPAPGAQVDLDESRRLFDQVAELNPEESGPFLRLGMLALRNSDSEAARKHFQTAAGFKSPEGLFFSGFLSYREGKYGEAASQFEKVLEMNQNEKRISGRGVFSEGDIAGSNNTMSPMEMAGVKALMYLHWVAAKLGRYPDGVPDVFRVHNTPAGAAVSIRKLPFPGNSVWCDLDSDSVSDLVIVGTRETRIYKNQAGKLHPAKELREGGFDAVCGDYDGDGRPDLYVIRSGYMGEGQNLLFRNEGGLSFRDVTGPSGLESTRATAAAAFVDVDGDGAKDLIEAGSASENGTPLRIYRNQNGVFRLQPVKFPGNAVSISVADYNTDGAPDLFVLRWRRPGLLYRNDGKGNFTDVTSDAGLQSAGGSSYSAVFLDYNNDSRPDLFVSRHAQYETALLCLLQPALHRDESAPQLFLNVSGNSFRPADDNGGLHRAYGTMKAIPADMDGDGWMDLVLANGGFSPWHLEPSVALRNMQGNGFTSWATFPQGPPEAMASCSVADADSDGRPEIYVH